MAAEFWVCHDRGRLVRDDGAGGKRLDRLADWRGDPLARDESARSRRTVLAGIEFQARWSPAQERLPFRSTRVAMAPGWQLGLGVVPASSACGASGAHASTCA